MTDRYDALTSALRELISARDVIKTTPDLTPSDLSDILGPLGDNISDAEYLLRGEHNSMMDDRHAATGKPERPYLGGAS